MIEKDENGVSPRKNDLYENLKKLPTKFFSHSNFNQNLRVNNCMSRMIEKQGKGISVSPKKVNFEA